MNLSRDSAMMLIEVSCPPFTVETFEATLPDQNVLQSQSVAVDGIKISCV